MPATRLIAKTFLLCAGLLSAVCGYAQGFPNRTIRIVTTEPGSTSDFLARLLAQRITPDLGRPAPHMAHAHEAPGRTQ